MLSKLVFVSVATPLVRCYCVLFSGYEMFVLWMTLWVTTRQGNSAARGTPSHFGKFIRAGSEDPNRHGIHGILILIYRVTYRQPAANICLRLASKTPAGAPDRVTQKNNNKQTCLYLKIFINTCFGLFNLIQNLLVLIN